MDITILKVIQLILKKWNNIPKVHKIFYTAIHQSSMVEKDLNRWLIMINLYHF